MLHPLYPEFLSSRDNIKLFTLNSLNLNHNDPTNVLTQSVSQCLMFQWEDVRSQLGVVVLGVQMGMSLMRRGVGRNCHNMPRQLAVLKAQGGDGNVGVVCVRVRSGGKGGLSVAVKSSQWN